MVDMKAKNISDNSQCHTDDITCLTISADRLHCATGQVGSKPVAFLWDAITGKK